MASTRDIRATAPIPAPPAGLLSPDTPAARSLVDVFAQTVARAGSCLALDAADATLTYAELSDAAGALAERLRATGVGPGDRIGVRLASGSSDLYVAILGVLMAGAAYVPVDADDPPARAAEIWASVRASAVVEDGLALARLSRPRGSDRALSPDDDAWVIFTSGSTGRPKGVAVTHRSAAAFVDAEARLWSVDPDDRVLAALSVGFDASCEEMWLAWRNGAALVPATRALVRSGADLGAWLCERGISVVSTVPTLAAMWSEEHLEKVRLLILGGEACPLQLGTRLARARELWNTYGPTEATVVSTAARVHPDEPITIGFPLAGWEVAVVDEHGEPVPFGDDGELVVAGVGLGRYLDDALDAERFAALPALGWRRAYRTGDIVRETACGLEFAGRRDDQVKLGGRRLELGEVDARLGAIPGVRAAAAAVHETAAGNPTLVGYVVGDVGPAEVRAAVAEQLPAGIAPLVVQLDELPRASSGKVDRKALPWPPPASDGEAGGELTGTAAWLAERWSEQLGPITITLDSDFFELGGTSVAAAKLVSTLRARFPSVAVADVYNCRRLDRLVDRLDALGSVSDRVAAREASGHRRWGAVQLVGVFALLALVLPQWLVGAFAVNNVVGNRFGPPVGWVWLVVAWLVFASAPGRALIVSLARRILLRRLEPGRYPRHSWLTMRLWFLERLGGVFDLENVAGTPWAAWYARLAGHDIGDGVSLRSLPPASSRVRIGDGATLETDVDIMGWWIEGNDLVVGTPSVGAGARIGTRSVLMPDADVGAGAEIEPGSAVTGSVPAGERWGGSPARHEGPAGEGWPAEPAPPPARRRFWRAMFGAGLAARNLLPAVAGVPALVLVALFAGTLTRQEVLAATAIEAPLIVITYLISYALLVAVLFRATARLIRPGRHPDGGATAWALWFSEGLLEGASGVLFPLYMSVYTRAWLRLLGIRVGKRTELSHVSTLNRLTSIGETSFGADEPAFATGRVRDRWLEVAPVEVGSRTFLGNVALMKSGTIVGDDSLIGVLTNAPTVSEPGTSWFGNPALELPRTPETPDPLRTTHPPRRLVVARGSVELVRALLPGSLTLIIGVAMFALLDAIGSAHGALTMVAVAPLVFLAAGLCATVLTVALKWLVMGRYRSGDHLFWSFFVWRDEIINSCQEQLAGAWLIGSALATPLMSAYLRAMGASVGADVWCDTLAITEFDITSFGDHCAVNRGAMLQTHLFHDRLLRLGPTTLEAGSTLGPWSSVLPDTRLCEGCSVGARSVVMRGEELPPGTRWHGTPVEAV